METVVKKAWHRRLIRIDPYRRPPSRRRKLVIGTILAAIVAVWLAPIVAARTGLRNRILAALCADLPGSVTADSASWGWFSSLEVRGLAVRDSKGRPLAEVRQVSIDRSLLGLLVDRSNLGTIRVQSPELTIELTSTGSNLEDFIAPLIDAAAEPPRGLRARLDVTDARIAIEDSQSSHSWEIAEGVFSATIPGDETQPIDAQASATLKDGTQTGRFEARLQATRDIAQPGIGFKGARGTISGESLALSLAEPFVRRVSRDSRLSGLLTSRLTFEWGGDSNDALSLAGKISTADLVVAGPGLGSDEFRPRQLDLPIELQFEGGRLQIHKFDLTCDVGRLDLRGDFDSTTALLESLAEESFDLSADCDLAALAAMLPNTIRVRDDTRIESGRIKLALSSRTAAEGHRWEGRLEADEITAAGFGRQVRWDQPILATAAVLSTPEGLVIEDLTCRSSFLRLNAGGTPEQGTATAAIDLGRLAQELSQFIDLGEAAINGDGQAEFGWRRMTDATTETTGKLTIHGLRWTNSTYRVWEEPLVNVAIAAAIGGDGTTRMIETASLTIDDGVDLVTANLTAPIAAFDSSATWPIHAELKGSLERVWPRVARLAPASLDLRLAGRCDGLADIAWSNGAIEIDQLQIEVRDLQAAGPAFYLAEPTFKLDAAGSLDLTSKVARADQVVVQAGVGNLSADGLSLPLAAGAAAPMSGRVRFDADLSRLAECLPVAASGLGWRIEGRLAGVVNAARDAAGTTANTSIEIEQFLATAADGTTWREPKLSLDLDAAYDPAADSMVLHKLSFQSLALRLLANGDLLQVSSRRELILRGEAEYDLQEIQRLLRPYLRDGVQVAGRETVPFTLEGPLGDLQADSEGPAAPFAADSVESDWLARLHGDSRLSWTWILAHGFQASQGAADVELKNGFLHVAPLEILVNQGRVVAAPVIRLSPGPVELLLPPGRLVDQVAITPEMCDAAIQYIAPALSGVTQATGWISIDLDACRVPLSSPERADLGGRFVVHSVEVGPGPLIQELAALLGGGDSARLTQESEVEFRMVDGRVYHRQMELVFPDVTVRTSGSVGLDQTLDLLAEMPVPPKWIGDNPLGDALRRRTIRVPIGGTLAKPRLNEQVLAQLSAEFFKNAAGDALLRGLNRGLEKLLPPTK